MEGKWSATGSGPPPSPSRTKSPLHLLRLHLISFEWRVMLLEQNTAWSNCLDSQLRKLEYIWGPIKIKHFVFSSVSWHLTKCRCLLLHVSSSFSTVQGCELFSVRVSISGTILMGRTQREVTDCHGKTEKHIRGHKPRIVGDPGYLSRYRDSLRAGRSGDRIPVGARFSSPVQSRPGVHPTFYTLGTGSFPGVMRPGCGVDHPPHLVPRLKKE